MKTALKAQISESVSHEPDGSVRLCADQDGDKKLTVSEFISLPFGTVENQHAQDVDDDWVKERKKEFEDVIDANHDGIVTMAELEVTTPLKHFP